MKKLHRGLRVLGLTELEAKVYIKLLEMKQARVTKLSNEVGVTRTQLYPLLEKLLEKGFVRRTEKSPAVYTVIDPDKLISMLDKWVREQAKLVNDIKKRLKKVKQ